MKKDLVLLVIICFLVAACQTQPPGPCPDAVNSPDGNVPFGSRACSPDSTKYAREIDPINEGHIGIFDAATDELISEVSLQESHNELKGLAWSPDNQWLGIMYHHGTGGYISIVDVATTDEITRVQINQFHHTLRFSDDGQNIIADGQSYPIDTGQGTSQDQNSQLSTAITSTPEPDRRFSIPLQMGASLVSWQQGEYSTASSDKALSQLRANGANAVAVIVTGYQETITSTSISRVSLATPTDADLVHVINVAHRLGISVMLKPHIDVNDPNSWRGQIGTGYETEDQWRQWFQSYQEFIIHYASLAETHGVEQFVVGTELLGTTHREQEWRTIISEVRKNFGGAITYAANHGGEENQIRFWDSVDLIGVDAYYPITEKNDPTVIELRDGWVAKGYVQTLESLANQFNRPVIFTEIGYRSVDGANKSPWEWHRSGDTDVQEQADAYRAMFEIFWDKPWFAGVYWWNWLPDPEKGGALDMDYTPQGKPAEDVLKAFYLLGEVSSESPFTPSATPTAQLVATTASQLYIAELANSDTGSHYQVIEAQSGRIVFTSQAQYSTFNEVKAGEFSPDWKKFAAAYHYSHNGGYTWIGVWSTESGEFLYAVTRQGWTTVLDEVFDQ